MSSIRYTFGSLDNPTPKVVSLFKSSYPSGRSYGAELKHDILSTLQFINEQRSIWIKMNRAAMRMAVTMSVASTDEVLTLYSRWIEVGLKCNIQQIKRISLRYNSELQRSYKHGIVDDSNIKRKMMRPEHFERGLPHNIRKQKQSQGSLVNKQRGVVSPWEGSEFKYELLCSLRTKLLKKVVLSAFKCYGRMCQNNRQCISSSTRSKLKRLMQLCFSSIMLEALSAKYIVFASNFVARKLLARKYLRPALSRLQLQVVNAQRYRALSKRSDPLYRRNMRRVGFRLLQWNVRYLESHRLLVKWAAKHTTQHSTLRAFTAWVASFIKKTRLREQIHARFSGNDENNVLQMEDQLKTPGRLSTTGYNTTFGANRSSATPLNATLTSLHPSAVLDQSPLANLRAAVSFYVDHSSRAGDGSGVSAVSFMSSSAAGKKGNMGESDSNVVTTDPGAFLGRSCQNTLNTHTRRSLRELRVAQLEAEAFRALNGSTVSRRSSSSGIGGDCGETSGPLHRDGNRSYLRTPSCSLHRTENHEEGFPGTQEGLLQAEVRMQLQSSLRARSLFPQPRFVAPISPGCADDGGSSESSGVNGSSRHRSNVWKNRHASRDGGHSDYVLNSAEESPEFSLSSDALSEQENEEFSSIEDLLLNVSTTTSSRISGNQAAARTSSGSARRAETSLLDKAIHESFVLSSPSYTYAAERDSDSLQGSPTMSTSALNGRQQGGDRRVGGGAGGSAAAPSSSSSAVPSAEAYFKRVASSGGFCGQVEVDSDLDMTISESSKHLSRNDGRGSRGAGGNTGHQRMLVHKQFVEQIQGAFQMIKFRWLIRSCRRFVRTLHRLAQRHKVAYQCSKLHIRSTRRRCWAAWRSAFQKQLAAGNLCDRIHCLKLGRRVLKEWRRQSIDRLLPASDQCYALARRNKSKETIGKWRSFFLQRRHQLGIDRVLQRSKKIRVFGHWKTYIGLLKQSKAIFYKMSKRVLRPIFQKWRKKYNQRTLLNRVFTLHDDAWRWRSYSAPSPFQRLYSVLTAWKVYIQLSLRERHIHALQTRAMYFRGASLLARHFHQWIDFSARQKQAHRMQRLQQRVTKGRFFHAWADRVNCHQQQVSALRHRVTVRSPLRRALYGWFRVSLGHAIYGPRRHHRRSLLQRAFDFLKTQRPLRCMEHRILPLCDLTRVKSSFSNWRDIIGRRAAYRRGLQHIDHSWLKLKVRLAFLRWPGRKESLLARQMCEFLANKHRDRIRLVECSEETKVVEVVSFIAKRRPTFAQRAFTHRFINNVADLQGLHYYQDLCSTILLLWREYITMYVAVRMRSYAVRNAMQSRTLRRTMMQWVLVTPKTSHRRVVWMVRAPRKAHDDYTYRRERDREFGVKLAKSNRELRYGMKPLPGTTIVKEPHPEDGEYYTDEEEGEYIVQKKAVTV